MKAKGFTFYPPKDVQVAAESMQTSSDRVFKDRPLGWIYVELIRLGLQRRERPSADEKEHAVARA